MNPADYAQLIYDVLENKTEEQQGQILGRFKTLLIKNKDTHLAGAIEKELEKIQRQKEQENVTHITSSSALSESQKQELESTFPGIKVFSENPSLLGGIAVRYKDKIYNATLRKKIEVLRTIF